MKSIFRLAVTLAGIIACLVAMASAGSLLLEAAVGERRDFGALGVSMLAVLIVGQCRALWVLSVGGSASAKQTERLGSSTQHGAAKAEENIPSHLPG